MKTTETSKPHDHFSLKYQLHPPALLGLKYLEYV